MPLHHRTKRRAVLAAVVPVAALAAAVLPVGRPGGHRPELGERHADLHRRHRRGEEHRDDPRRRYREGAHQRHHRRAADRHDAVPGRRRRAGLRDARAVRREPPRRRGPDRVPHRPGRLDPDGRRRGHRRRRRCASPRTGPSSPSRTPARATSTTWTYTQAPQGVTVGVDDTVADGVPGEQAVASGVRGPRGSAFNDTLFGSASPTHRRRGGRRHVAGGFGDDVFLSMEP